MTNHYHLVIETPDANLARGMRQLNGVYKQLRRNLSRKDFVPLRGAMGYPVIFVVVFPGDHHYADS